MKYQEYYREEDTQRLFNTQVNGLLIAAKYLFRLFIYSPLIFTAYAIAGYIMNRDDLKHLNGLLMIILITGILYLFVYFLKGLLVGLKLKGNLLWILLFLFCLAFTCVLPVYLAFEPIDKLIASMGKSQKPDSLLTWVASLAVGYIVYLQYNFLTDIAPRWAFPLYKAGFDLAFGSGGRKHRRSNNTI